MASSSSSASNSQNCSRWKYDVFLSFRGDDTRNNFTSHLHKGLKNRGIFTFLDDERLEDGDFISEELVQAIEESQVAVIVFSKNYAKSSWCLNELVKIMECKEKENRQTVIPVFYYVDASHVRYQSESFAEAFAKHETRYKDDVEGMQKVQGWRNALTGAANLKGHDIHDGINQSMKIDQIVDHISSKLCRSARFLSDLQDVVGINSHLEKLESLLQIEINNVQIVGIWGTGGIGKTTIANAIFDTLSNQFEAACFLANVKENAKKNQLHSLQNTLLSILLRKKDDYVSNEYDGKRMIKSRLSSMKVLIVLDDIDHGDHLEYLAGDVDWFGNGSKVIVTTRNRKLIENNDAIYEVHTLPDHEAMQLFNQYAFKKEVPNECFKKFSLEVVNQANGLPLALKVWGSLLHKKGIDKWKKIVDQIKKHSNSEIVEKLKISYDGLEPKEQKIFLDIACFFRGENREEVIQIVECYGSGAEYILDVLIDKSLVFISVYDDVEMHDLIEDMGKYIVKMQKDSGEPSRIWNVEDFKDVMMDNMRTMAVEAIWFTYFQQLSFNKEAMKNMKMLRILCIFKENEDDFIYSSDSNSHDGSTDGSIDGSTDGSIDDSTDGSIDDSTDGSIEYLSNNLCWFVWHDYPWKLLPRNFNPRRLVHFGLRWSSLHYLWNETELQQFLSLRRIDLSHSESLKRTPDFKGMPNLESLNLKGCRSLEEVHPSLKYCRKLIILNLYRCESLERFPYVNVESLEYLNLNYCNSLQKFPEILGIMKPELGINMSCSGIRELPLSYFDLQPHLTELDLRGMDNLVSLPSSICKLKGLVRLNVSECSKLESLPEEIGDLENLEELHASNTLISRPPSSIVCLNKLKSLKELDLSHCNIIDGGLSEDIGSLSSLQRLNLSGNNFEYLPRSIAQLGALEYLNLSDCERLTQLPEFPRRLYRIDADWSNDSFCNSLFQNISSLQHDICSSDPLSLRVFRSFADDIPSWFNYQGMCPSVSVDLPENWYESDKFLGLAVCYSSEYYINYITAHLIPLSCDDGMSSMTQQFALSNHSELDYPDACNIIFLLVPLDGLWDASNVNGKTLSDYGCIKLDIDDDFGEKMKFGVRLLYKDESELCIGTTKSRDEEEASCSSSKKQRQI
ncbi:hypothetical protein KY289_007294 [Solanum tuberosum]|nr:hypothetical protein KY289_007294 [Solanum tuberosum]